jgi:hypothetical protein
MDCNYIVLYYIDRSRIINHRNAFPTRRSVHVTTKQMFMEAKTALAAGESVSSLARPMSSSLSIVSSSSPFGRFPVGTVGVPIVVGDFVGAADEILKGSNEHELTAPNKGLKYRHEHSSVVPSALVMLMRSSDRAHTTVVLSSSSSTNVSSFNNVAKTQYGYSRPPSGMLGLQ